MAPSPGSPTSLSLLQRVRSDDQEAWRQLVHLYGPLVHRWCKRGGLGDADTADVFQETFRSVFQRIATFESPGSPGAFRSWLRVIVRNKVIDHVRRRDRQPAAAGGSAAAAALRNAPDPLGEDSQDEIAAENALVVRRALELISPEFSPANLEAFRRVAIEGRSAVEVAGRMGVNAQAVRQANYRIRRRLRQVLQDLAD